MWVILGFWCHHHMWVILRLWCYNLWVILRLRSHNHWMVILRFWCHWIMDLRPVYWSLINRWMVVVMAGYRAVLRSMF